MKKFSSSLGSSGGYTLLELLIAVAVLSIISSIVIATYDTLQARVRYSQMRANMDAIAMAGYTDYTSNGLWAALQNDGTLPSSFAASNSLQKWPSPPCPNWTYTWDNWSDFGGVDIANVIRVTLRDLHGTAIWSYCVDNIGGSGNCFFPDPISGATPSDVVLPSTKYIYCNQ